MNTVKIEIPEGFLIDSVDTSSGEVKFKAKPKDFSRIKTVEDILSDNGLTQAEFDERCAGHTQDEKAYRIIKLLAKSLNEGWVPDWSDSSQYKYFPWFEMLGPSGFRFGDFVGWGSGSAVGARLCFKSRELAEHAGKNFTEVYKQFMTID